MVGNAGLTKGRAERLPLVQNGRMIEGREDRLSLAGQAVISGEREKRLSLAHDARMTGEGADRLPLAQDGRRIEGANRLSLARIAEITKEHVVLGTLDVNHISNVLYPDLKLVYLNGSMRDTAVIDLSSQPQQYQLLHKVETTSKDMRIIVSVEKLIYQQTMSHTTNTTTRRHFVFIVSRYVANLPSTVGTSSLVLPKKGQK